MRWPAPRRYLPPALGIAALYLLNRFWLIPVTGGTLHRLLAWHGADFLAGGAMVLVLQGARALFGYPPERRRWAILGYLLLCGAFWEGVTPLYLPRSVGDPRDVAAVALGGMALLLGARIAPPSLSPFRQG